jgi:hypothetical protein
VFAEGPITDRSAVPVDDRRTGRAVGHQRHIVAKHMYIANAAIPPKTYVGQIGKADLGVAANCEA